MNQIKIKAKTHINVVRNGTCQIILQSSIKTFLQSYRNKPYTIMPHYLQPQTLTWTHCQFNPALRKQLSNISTIIDHFRLKSGIYPNDVHVQKTTGMCKL